MCNFQGQEKNTENKKGLPYGSPPFALQSTLFERFAIHPIIIFVYCFYRTGTGKDSASYDIFVYKNGSLLNDAEDMQSFTVSQSYNTIQCTGMLDLSAGDYLEMYAKSA